MKRGAERRGQPKNERAKNAITRKKQKWDRKGRWETKGIERKVDIVLQYDNLTVAFFLSTSDSLHGHLSPLSVSSSLCHYLQVNDPLCSYFLSDTSICISLSVPLVLSLPSYLSLSIAPVHLLFDSPSFPSFSSPPSRFYLTCQQAVSNNSIGRHRISERQPSLIYYNSPDTNHPNQRWK